MTDMDRLLRACAMLERENISLEDGLERLRWAKAERDMRMKRLRPAAAMLSAAALLFAGGLIGYGITMPAEPEVVEVPRTDGPPVEITIPTPYEVAIPKYDDQEISIPMHADFIEIELGEFRFEGLEREIDGPEDVSFETLSPDGVLNVEEDGRKHTYTEPGRDGRIEAWLLEDSEGEDLPEPGMGELKLLVKPDGGVDSVCCRLKLGGGWYMDLTADGYSLAETLEFIAGISIR